MSGIPIPVPSRGNEGLLGAAALFVLVAALFGSGAYRLRYGELDDDPGRVIRSVFVGIALAALFFYLAWTPLHLKFLSELTAGLILIICISAFAGLIVGFLVGGLVTAVADQDRGLNVGLAVGLGVCALGTLALTGLLIFYKK